MASSNSPSVEVNRFGLTEVYSPSNPQVDLVLVHGLNGNPRNTWTSEKSKVFWPELLLPPFIEEQQVRVLVYGYDADVTSFTDGGVSKDKIHNHAERLIADLFANRRIRKATERPLLFVAHSLGGLVVKRALISSSEIRGPKTEHLRSIFVSTYGILFLGTPHKGSDIAQWGSRLEWICHAVMPKKLVDTEPQLVDALKRNSETLQNIDRQFTQLMDRYHIFFFHEAKPTDIKGTFRFVVDEDSAAPTVPDVERAGIQADHSHMCKFESNTSPGFDLVVDGIQRYAEDSSSTIKTRWEAERLERKGARKQEAALIYPDDSSTSGTPDNSIYDLERSIVLPKSGTPRSDQGIPEMHPKPTEPFFIVPPGFRPNTFFVGMEKELKILDQRLFDRRRREGTACVLLHGPAGAGKSHLARQYVNKNKGKFKGGIFWIGAKLKEEPNNAFWEIAQKVVSKDAPEFRSSDDGKWGVKEWFESRQDWLVIFDGVSVDTDEDATEFQRLVPDNKNCSLIYISRARRLESMQRLLRPFPIKVPPLKEEDARKLLFKELHMKKPSTAEIKSATDLVKKLGGLPLAIHAISHRLAETREPLTKFKIKSYSADPRLWNPYNEILGELEARGHIEAWNLINILCFYGSHLPVEMVHLGLRALNYNNIAVKSSENEGRPDLNSTFGILMRYALIERNEPDDKDSMSGSRDSLVDPEPIDMLKMHSVAQKFCRDSLDAKKLLAMWLTYAVRLFCTSYQEADLRIRQKPDPARISDYRVYLIHGQRLREHSTDYESKSQLLEHIRTELDPVLFAIREEIRIREPGSSQESVDRTTFQISIFDRTSSSSASAQSEASIRTSDHRPPPLPLDPHQNKYGMDNDKPALDSPRSIHTTSPLYRPAIMDFSPSKRFPPGFDDTGYQTEMEGTPRSYPMQQSLSDVTTRPDISSPGSQNEGWQTVASSRKEKKPGYTRDLGNFRPTAMTGLDRQYAMGSIAKPKPETRTDLSGSSDALTSLTRVHHASPPPSRGGGSIWSRTRSPAPSLRRPTYARVLTSGSQKVASEQQSGPVNIESTLSDDHFPSPHIETNERGRPRESLVRRSGNMHQSPLKSEFVAESGDAQSISRNISRHPLPSTSRATVMRRPLSRARYHDRQPAFTSDLKHDSSQVYITENTNPNYRRPTTSGPNPAPLPLETDITITSKRPLPADFRSHNQPTSFHPTSASFQEIFQPQSRSQYSITTQDPFSPVYPSQAQPQGYYSQPTSRHPSQQSHASAAATEPSLSHPPPFSPYLSSLPIPDPGSPRDRLPDGAPPRKSPKFEYAYPTSGTSPSQRSNRSEGYDISPHSPNLLSGTGGWVAPATPTLNSMSSSNPLPSTRYSSSPLQSQFHPHSQPLNHSPQYDRISRSGSSPGPGLAVEDNAGHRIGLGIAEFGGDGAVKFGDFEPVNIEHARRRALEWEGRLREREKAERHESDNTDRDRGRRMDWDEESDFRGGYGSSEDEEWRYNHSQDQNRDRYMSHRRTVGHSPGESASRSSGRENERPGAKRGSMPYPDVNLIPAEEMQR